MTIDGAGAFEAFSSWCADEVARTQAPSLSVAVGIANKLVFAEAYGMADLNGSRRATPETAYLLASVTKPLTATLTCLLADRRKIDLDDPIDTYLGDTSLTRPADSPPPTVRDVLQHTSGLGTFWEFVYVDTDGTRRSFAESIARYGVLVAPARTRYRYSNLGYGLLDEVIGNVAKTSPEEFARTELFEPLAMTSAHIGPSYPGGEALTATRYSLAGEAYPMYDMCHRGASLAWMNPCDLVRFGFSQTEGSSVLSKEMSREMLTGVDIGPGKQYGLGWTVSERAGNVFVGHSGSMPGVLSVFTLVPAHQLVIAAVCNQSGAMLPGEAVNRLLELLVPGFVRPATIPPPTDPSEIDGRWRGTISSYAGEIPLSLDVEQGGRVWVSLGSDDSAVASSARQHAPHANVTADFAAIVPLQLPTPDARVRSPQLELILNRTGDRLTGAAAACLATETDGPGERIGNYYSHWCELTRLRERRGV